VSPGRGKRQLHIGTPLKETLGHVRGQEGGETRRHLFKTKLRIRKHLQDSLSKQKIALKRIIESAARPKMQHGPNAGREFRCRHAAGPLPREENRRAPIGKSGSRPRSIGGKSPRWIPKKKGKLYLLPERTVGVELY